jgi:hypothetical protein
MPNTPKLVLSAVLAAASALGAFALSAGASSAVVACDVFPDDASSSSSSSSSSSGAAATTTGDGSTARVSIDANTLCTRLLNQCGQSIVLADCIKSYASLRVDPSCMTGIGSATCADITDSSSAVMQTCFPPCNGTLASCNDDATISTCNQEGQTQVYDCREYCIAQGFTAYTGTCGLTYQGQTAAAPQCWCQ